MPHARPAPPETAPLRLVLLLIGPGRAALESLARQHGTQADVEAFCVDAAPTHRQANDALRLSDAALVTVCDAGLALPDDFVATALAHFDAAPAAGVLHHAVAGQEPDPAGACCFTLRRGDALRLGGFDEDAVYERGTGAPHELAWRLFNTGLDCQWHDRALPAPQAPTRRDPAAIDAAAAVLREGRLLPRTESEAMRSLRLAMRRPSTPQERRLCGVDAEPPAAAAVAATLDWRDIPVFIVNRNRLAALQRLVAWLREAGTRRIVIMDNASDYPPLLDWYRTLPPGVDAMLLPENHGPYVLWQQKVHEVMDTPYVLTDSDIVPDDACPADLIGRLLEVLQRHPDAKKVGPALRIDDLPDSYGEADTVRKWESQFWEHPVAPGLFAAPIDTTFALYPAHGAFSNEACNLRLGAPYLARHTPWYVDEAALDDEERHYRTHTSATFSNWSVGKKDSWVKRSERVAQFGARPKVLHLDGGREYIPGWINAGAGAGRFDLAFDPCRARAQPLDLPDGVLDGLYVGAVLTRVRDAQPLFDELWRVAKPGAKLVVRVPHGSNAEAWDDPATRRSWTEGSFAALSRASQPADSSARGDWQIESVSMIGASEATPHELVAVLHAVKPAQRALGRHPCEQPSPRLLHDDCVDPAFAVA